MDHEDWHSRWRENRLGFHEPEGNQLFAAHFGALDLAVGSRLFVPLCGKTRDIGWLLSKGYRVAGAELSPLAIDQLFQDLELVPDIRPSGSLTHYSGPGIDVFVGDIFDLTADQLGQVDAVFDRAALVALPAEVRQTYAPYVTRLTNHARQFLVTFDYDQSVMNGPPFSVPLDEVQQLYRDAFQIEHYAQADVPGGLKGICPATEIVWLLTALPDT
ncbi:MAG: thiopurine S-methyltransferase [Pseudomonadota bacterium]